MKEEGESRWNKEGRKTWEEGMVERAKRVGRKKGNESKEEKGDENDGEERELGLRIKIK